MNHYGKQLAAAMLLAMDDLLASAKPGAKVIMGGGVMEGRLSESNRKYCEDLLKAPSPADEPVIWHDRIPKKHEVTP